MHTARGERGLTLLETVISIALLAMVLLVMYGLVGVGIRGWVSLTGQADVQQHPRIAAGRVLAEVSQSKDVVIGAGGTSLGLVKVTQLAADAPAGAASVIVEDAFALVAGRPVVLLNLNSQETLTASAIAGTTVSVAPALARAHRRGEVVRRGQTSLSAAAAAGSTVLTVANAASLCSPVTCVVADAVAVGGESPLTVTGIVGNLVSVSPALTQSHAAGENVQPLTVVFQLSGTQLMRNGVVLADLLAVPPGRALFSVISTTLTAATLPGTTLLCVQSVTGFAINDRIQVDREVYGADQAVIPDRRTVVGVNGVTNCLTVDRGLTAQRAVGAAVRVLAVEMNVLGTQFNSAIGQTQEVAVTSKAALRN